MSEELDCYVNNNCTEIYARFWFGEEPPKGYRLANFDKAQHQMTERHNRLNGFDIKEYLTKFSKSNTLTSPNK